MVQLKNITMQINDLFHRLAVKISNKVGSPKIFLLALLVVAVWALTGPIFDFSDTWQLIINTGTTIVTFLMVFIIQNTQNRDNKAVQLKLDELVRAVKGARLELVDVEDLSDEEIRNLDEDFKKLHAQGQLSQATQKVHHRVKNEHLRRQGQ